MSWFSRIANALRPGRAAADLAEELQFHADQRGADLIREGVPRAEAERLARRQLGNSLRIRESSRDVKSAVWIESLLQDFRFGLRMLAKYRKSSLAAIISLALAIGACTATFELIDALIFRPLPVAAPSELIDLARLQPGFSSPDNQPHFSASFSYPQYRLLRDAGAGRAELFAITPGLRLSLFDDAGGFAENLRVEAISGEGFRVLGVRPARGRLIQAEDDSAANPGRVAVISYGFWRRHFGGSQAALGERLRFAGQSYEIVGVAAPSFFGVEPGYLVDAWLPLSAVADLRTTDPDDGGLRVWGRVRREVNRAQLRDRLAATLTNFLRERVRINPPRSLRGTQIEQLVNAPLLIRDASSGADSLFRIQFRRPLWILVLICALLLLLACSNVATLTLARASARDAEMALRVSLGAGRLRLIRQMLIESAQVAVAACVLSVGFAAFAAPAMVARLGSPEFPAWLDVEPRAATLAFAAGLSLLAGMLFGIVPALRASAASPATGFKAAGLQHSSRVGPLRWMLATEVGFSVAVLFLSGLLLISFRRLTTVDLGFDPGNVALFEIAPSEPVSPAPKSDSDLLAYIRALPGVQSASISQQRPMGGDIVFIQMPVIRLPGRPAETIRPREVPIATGFFKTMRIRWIAGRDFLPEEIAAGSSSVIVNQAFADTFFPGRDPIGRRFEKIGDDPDPIREQIVGVVGNARWNNLREPVEPSIYTPLEQIGLATLSVRTAAAPAPLIPDLRKRIAVAAPDISVRSSILLQDQIDSTLLRERLLAILAGFFSVLALLLSAVGLYGVINYATLRRTREIGIRIALGASREWVVREILSDTAAFVFAGIGAGLASGLAFGRYLSSQLYAVTPTDFSSVAAPVGCILLVALAAALPPALRAAGADALIALKYE
ncbi:MAG: ABC transporter permease [Bryobacterales bacterium]|nr:ABC transporter permease [Bryobacterales bacterium]MBV9397306.1 ABC transporter permease [Bryobacterales bacterium]